MTKPFTMLAAVLFAVGALLHVFRLFTGFHIILGSHSIPIWCSYIAIVVGALLAWGLYRESKS